MASLEEPFEAPLFFKSGLIFAVIYLLQNKQAFKDENRL